MGIFSRRRGSAGSFRWPVSRPLSPGQRSELSGERYLRKVWVSRRGGFFRLALWVLAAWGAWNIIGSSHGVLRLRALAREQADLQERLSAKQREYEQVKRELQESPGTELERGVREKYFMSRKGEIVYHLRRTTESRIDSEMVEGSGGDWEEAPEGVAGENPDAGSSAEPSGRVE